MLLSIILPLAIISFIIAALYSNLGLGGGIMYVPALILIGQLGKDSAVAVSLCLVLAGSLAALYQHNKAGNVDMKLVGYLSVGSGIGAVFGSFFNLNIGEETFRWLFLAVILGLSAWMVIDLFRSLRPDCDDDSKMCTPYLGAAVGIAVFAGFLSGAFGIGGGALLVPALIYVLCRHVKLAVGTSAATIVPTTLVGATMYFIGGFGQLSGDTWQFILVLAPISFIGAFLGTKAGIARLTGKQIKTAFLVLTVLVAVIMVAELFF
ncbi:MAG: sulfite exporter TauE/SafE family protein [Thermoplasmata archaeon]|nr:sulfite exporter TauE/SafE family protein [Thermoplasmata archaeon]